MKTGYTDIFFDNEPYTLGNAAGARTRQTQKVHQIDGEVSRSYPRDVNANTSVYAVADGGNGLREALSQQFPKLTFILDRPHLKHHLYKGAEAMGLTGPQQSNWVNRRRCFKSVDTTLN